MTRFPDTLPAAFALAERGFTLSEIANELSVAYWAVKRWAEVNEIKLPKYRHTLKPAAERAIALAMDGTYVAEIARQVGMSQCGVRLLLKRYGVVAGKCEGLPFMSPESTTRAESMASMYRQGLTLETIGQHFGLTRERVRQILAKFGVNPDDGGQRKNMSLRRKAKQNGREARSIAAYGLGWAEVNRLREAGMLQAFRRQKGSADARGIAWKLTLLEWLSVWQESGKLEQRGRGKGGYCMSRIKDAGCYEIGNVHIQLSTENSKEAVKQWLGKTKTNRGVYHLYPGTANPWQARFGKVKLGFFATEAEAVAAREAFFAEHPEKLAGRRGRGYSVTHKDGRVRYQVAIGARYIGSYRTPEAALAARAAALQAMQTPAPSSL